jgi:NAD-dependent DNA ligase
MNPSELLSLSQGYLSCLNNIKIDDILILREVIREHNRLYHIVESPIISDTEYDQLFHALARAESDSGMLDAESPTAHLAILAGGQFQKVRHVYPMISLDNTYSVEEVREWNERMLKIIKKEKFESSPPEKVVSSPLLGDELYRRRELEGVTQRGIDNNVTPPSLPFSGEGRLRYEAFSYYIQPKYDGLGLAVVYEYGKLAQAITRGSGVE